MTPNHHPRWAGWLYRSYIQLYREADALIALTPSERDTFIQLGTPPERVHVVGAPGFLSTNPDAERFRGKHQVDGPIVLFVGQKYAYKGFDLLLQASREVWKEHADTTFVFIGPRTDYSEKVFAKHKSARILELGTVSLEEKSEAMAACDVFCMPSAQESFGHVFVEAWTLGKPVIAADIPATRDLISHSNDGLVVPRTPDAIADAIKMLLRDSSLRDALGSNGKRKVELEYTMPTIMEKTSGVYRAALTGS